MDFNPIGGTTSPLLFDWAELPYTLSSPSPRSDELQSSGSAAAVAESTDSIANGTGDTSADAASPVRPSGGGSSASPGVETEEQTAGGVSSHEGSNGSASGNGNAHEHGEAASGWPGEIEFRLNTGGAVMRPSVAAYGAPFDMVDNSEGSAISELLRRLQTEEVD